MSDKIPQDFCTSCVAVVPLKHIQQLRNGGKHIKFGRKEKPWGPIYDNHAIVTTIDETEETVTYIEFSEIETKSSQKGLKVEVTENTCKKFKDLKNANLVVYRERYLKDREINERAYHFLNNSNLDEYSFPTNNCEHLANTIVTGVPISWRTKTIFTDILAGIDIVEFHNLPECVKSVADKSVPVKIMIGGIQKFITKTKEFIGYAAEAPVNLLEGAKKIQSFAEELSGLLSVFEPVVPIIKIAIVCAEAIMNVAEIKSLKKANLLCKDCHNKRLLKLVIRSLLGFIQSFVGPFGDLAALAYNIAGHSLYKKIDKSIHPAAEIPKWQIKSWDQLQEGDVLTLNYMEIPHQVLVTGISPGSNPRKRNIRCIHYAFRILGDRKIIEEDLERSIDSSRLLKHDYSTQLTYSVEETLRRARGRLGEKKFNTLTNRSSHFVKYCKEIDLTDEKKFTEALEKLYLEESNGEEFDDQMKQISTFIADEEEA